MPYTLVYIQTHTHTLVFVRIKDYDEKDLGLKLLRFPLSSTRLDKTKTDTIRETVGVEQEGKMSAAGHGGLSPRALSRTHVGKPITRNGAKTFKLHFSLLLWGWRNEAQTKRYQIKMVRACCAKGRDICWTKG